MQDTGQGENLDNSNKSRGARGPVAIVEVVAVTHCWSRATLSPVYLHFEG